MRRFCCMLLVLFSLTLVTGCGGDRQNFKGKDKPVPPTESKSWLSADSRAADRSGAIGTRRSGPGH
jgi:hypothetical protein